MATRWVRLIACNVIGLCCVACGGSTTPAAATSPRTSPTPDAATTNYVSLVHNYWLGIVAADNVSGQFNEASRTCLGTTTSNAPRNVNLVEPATCRTRALAIVAVQEKFAHDLATTIVPERFANDDRIFRSQVPLAIAALKTLIAVAATGKKQAVFDAANVYADIMLSSVTGALDEVDPTVTHY